MAAPNNSKEIILEGQIDGTSDTLRVALLNNSTAYTFDPDNHTNVDDVIDGGEMEKEDHEWQQPVIEASELIEGLTEPDQTVCDPMCGSGTFGVAALRSNRRAVLIDVDEKAVAKTRERVGEVVLDE